MSISSPCKYKGYLAIQLLALALSFPVAEGIFRLMGDRPSPDLAGLYVKFGAGAYKLGPMVDTEAIWAAGRFTVHTDDLGLRCDDARHLGIKPGDKVDVLLLGDSQGFGHGVSFDESLAGGVAELALRDGIRVANASVGGHSALNQLEVARWLHQDEKVAISNYVLLVTPLMVRYSDSYTRTAVGKDGRLYDDPSDRMAYVRLWVKTHFVVYNRLRDALSNSGIGNKPKDDMPAVFRVFGTGDSEEISHHKFATLLRQFKDFADAQGASVRVVYVPLTIEADFDAVRHTAESRGVALDPDMPARVCSKAAAELGIPMQSLKPVLKQLREQGDPLRLKGDFHYDRTLSQACAAIIWNNLKNAFAKSGHPNNENNTKSTYGN